MNASVTMDVEVRWGECDPAGIVYHPVYLDWFSTARIHYFRKHGIHYMEMLHDAGVDLVVLEAHCRYLKAVRAEDFVTVEATLQSRTRTRLGFTYRVLNRAGDLCVVGRTEHAFVDQNTKPVNLAKRLPQVWEKISQLPCAPIPKDHA